MGTVESGRTCCTLVLLTLPPKLLLVPVPLQPPPAGHADSSPCSIHGCSSCGCG
jgi:hypothetical protein